MVRAEIIKNAVLEVYRTIPEIKFPFPIRSWINSYSNCRSKSYQEAAEANRTSLKEVIATCGSKSGCTNYYIKKGFYYILVNEAENPGRVRWTYAHELGHIMCGHFGDVESTKSLSKPEYEREADLFAASLLCPMPLFDLLEIYHPNDIENRFGVSTEAANNVWRDYQRAIRSGVDFKSETELRFLFQTKRPQDELLFDVPCDAVLVPDVWNPLGKDAARSYWC